MSTTTMWNPATHQDYDTLKGFEVYLIDQEKFGTVKEVLHPRDEMPAARGKHYFRVEPGMMKKVFSDQDEIFISEALIADVRPADNRFVLRLTQDQLKNADWSRPRDYDTFRRS